MLQRAHRGDLLEVLVDGRGAHLHRGGQFLHAQGLALVVADPVHRAGDAVHLAVGGGDLPQPGVLVDGDQVVVDLPLDQGRQLGLGMAGFASRMLHRDRLYPLLRYLPLGLAAVTLAMTASGQLLWAVAAAMVGWGALNAAIPVCWSTWLASELGDEPESGGGLLVASIQLAIMLGGAMGGQLLDHASTSAPLVGGRGAAGSFGAGHWGW